MVGVLPPLPRWRLGAEGSGAARRRTGRRPRTRRVALHALLAQEPSLDGAVDAPARRAGRQAVDAFVVTRAVVGVVRAAVLEDSPLLTTPEFEDALVRLARALATSPP